jgi:hypothetical protein
MDQYFAVRTIRQKLRTLFRYMPNNANDTLVQVREIDKLLRNLEETTIDHASILHDQPSLFWDNPRPFLGIHNWSTHARDIADQRAGAAATLSNVLCTALDEDGVRRYQLEQE